MIVRAIPFGAVPRAHILDRYCNTAPHQKGYLGYHVVPLGVLLVVTGPELRTRSTDTENDTGVPPPRHGCLWHVSLVRNETDCESRVMPLR